MSNMVHPPIDVTERQPYQPLHLRSDMGPATFPSDVDVESGNGQPFLSSSSGPPLENRDGSGATPPFVRRRTTTALSPQKKHAISPMKRSVGHDDWQHQQQQSSVSAMSPDRRCGVPTGSHSTPTKIMPLQRRRTGNKQQLRCGGAREGFGRGVGCDMTPRDFMLACAIATLLLVLGFLIINQGRIQTGGITNRFTIMESPNSLPWSGGDAAKDEYAVFYNVFISTEPYLARVARFIVEEQLGQLGTSYAASGGDLHVYYTSIGDEIDTAWVTSLCSVKYNMTCTHMQHYKSADEQVTLRKLYNHCQNNPEQSVIYLHNKGSLHPNNKGQHRWRRTMTAAATSQLCLEPTNEQCNACGMLYQPIPGSHFPGNMWMSKCSYIKRLLSPDDYHARQPMVDEWVRTETKAGIFAKYGGLFPLESHYMGKNRYAAEYWMGSHPTLVPCDVSVEPNKDYWLEGDRNFSKEFVFGMAPRQTITANWIWYSYTAKNSTLTDPSARLRDYFLLRGVIYRWLAFYGEVASDDSWVWKWFPDAPIWKAAIDGRGALVAINDLADRPGAAEIAFPTPTAGQAFLDRLRYAVSALKFWG